MSAGPVAFFRPALVDFTSSSSQLRIVRTITRGPSSSAPSPTPPPPPPPSRILVLDSSFNPPTRAHLQIATSALRAHGSPSTPQRLLLLLATQNADKAPKPAAFEQRLRMMALLAEDVLAALGADGTDGDGGSGSSSSGGEVAVDIGLTTLPYFVGKAKAISAAPEYLPSSSSSSAADPVEQIHLVGFDTLVRILDTKYYPPRHTLAPLAELFRWHRLRVTMRTDDRWGREAEQREYLEALRRGHRERDGGHMGWAERIELVEGWRGDGGGAVSSTEARGAAERGDAESVGRLCTAGVAGWVLGEGLYK